VDRAGEFEGWLIGLAGWCAEVIAAAEPLELEDDRDRVRELGVGDQLAVDIQLAAARDTLAILGLSVPPRTAARCGEGRAPGVGSVIRARTRMSVTGSCG
jgi:hypothetical protein